MTTYKHKVHYYETDKMGITHHSNYIRIMEEARFYILEELGLGFDKMEEKGIVSPVVKISCDYINPTTYADEIDVHVSILECKRVKLTLGYKMMLDDKVVCTGKSVHCFLNSDGNPISIEKMSPELYDVIMENIEK